VPALHDIKGIYDIFTAPLAGTPKSWY